LGCKLAKSEHAKLTEGEIIFEEFQPICDHNSQTLQTDGQTDDMRSQYQICTKVRRAVKT